MIRTITELKKLKTFEERYLYLRLGGIVGEKTFGYDRYLNQILYKTKLWKQIRDEVIIRDNGCDLGVDDYKIYDRVVIHHINPMTIKDVETRDDKVFNPEFLICTTINTHNAIHYGDIKLIQTMPIERKKNDTCPWL